MKFELKKTNPIVVSFFLLFAVSVFFLFWTSNRHSDLNYEKNWWAIYFSEAKGDSLDFWIENHSNENYFRFEIWQEKNKLQEESLSIEKGEKKEIKIDENGLEKTGKIKIQVFAGEDLKSISKNF